MHPFHIRPSPDLASDHKFLPECLVKLSRTLHMHQVTALYCPCLYRSLSYSGQQFNEFSEHEQRAALDTLCVLSRVEPLHKLRLVDMLKRQVRSSRAARV